MPTTLKRTNSNRDSPETEPSRIQKKPKKDRHIQKVEEEEEIMEEDDDIEYSGSNDEVDDDMASSNGPSTRDLDNIDLGEMRVNDAGTIARVEVVNFMCHKYLKIDLGPKINFVIGHNGSGKSAILTAITIALGANASATNRGKNLSSFIKEGSNVANITIHLTNGGQTPYKPDLYPDIIIIERRLNNDGPSPYKIKNSSGRVVSTKKEELVAILDHMNLLVNNPLTMLTQDMARKFLSDSTSEDKYKLFMHGTQLTHLQNDFESVRESLDTARATLDRKKQGLPALAAKADEARRRYEDIEAAKEIEDKIDVLNNELVWSQIINKEKESIKYEQDALVAKRQLDQIQEACEAQSEKIRTCTRNIESTKEEWEASKNVPNPDEDEKNALMEEKAKKELIHRECKSDLVEINNTIKTTKTAKENHQRNLKIETDKLEASSRLKRNEILDEIEKLKERMRHKERKAKQFNIEQGTLEKEAREEQQKRQELFHEKADGSRRLRDARDLIEKLEAQRGNSMKAYGPRMPDVLDAIRRETRWEKRRPVGPFGSTLSLLKPEFGDTLESVLKNSLNAFVVETFRDKALLFAILERFHMKFIPIFVSDYDLFDYSSGEPNEEHLTILRAIKFNDEWVKRQLITANKIEKVLLMEDRARADEIMSRKPRNIDLCFTSGGYKVGGKAGMKTESVDPYRGVPRFQKDVDSEIRKQRTIEAELKKKDQELELEIRQLHLKISDLENRAKECKRSENGLDRDIQYLKRQIVEKEDVLKEDDPVDLNMYHDDIKECEEKIRSHAQQFQSIKAQQDANVRELQEVLKKLKVVQSRELAREEYNNEFRVKINKMEDLKTKLNTEMQSLNAKKQTFKLRYESKHQSYLESARMVEQWIEQSKEDYPDRVDTERTPHEVEKDIRHLQGIATDMENEMGISPEELQRQTFEIIKAWSEANEIVKGMEKLSRSLKKMLTARIEKWEKFRTFIALSAKHYFSYYLHMRGDEGSLRFNHETKRLDIRVSTGDQYSKGSRQKDSRSLSGGEKSFSQISLLLSLWQSISSPLICLDEFDVFMDAVNRKQTMSMIMNAAGDNTSQYILITPQDASNMKPGPYITVHRLADPDRT